MAVVLQVDFNMSAEMLGDALSKSAVGLAGSINQEPGFISKIWTENKETEKETEEAGGIYLFTDRNSAERYWQMHKQRIASFGVTHANCKIFDINEPLTLITHGKID